MMAIALAAVRAGWSEKAYRAAMLDPRNAGGAKLREHSPQWGDVELGRCWAKAVAMVASTPVTAATAEVRRRVDELIPVVEHVSWPGQAGATDRHVLLTALAKVQILGRAEFPWSEREAAEAAAVSKPTILTSRRRLEERGLLVEQPVDEGRSVWVVRLDAVAELPSSARVFTNPCHTPPHRR